MSASTIGLLVGIALGFAAAFGGFGAFAIVAVLAVIGFVVGKVVEGDLDLSPYLSGRGRTRR
jgi:ABC-type sulfate transport system permease component